MDLVGKTVARVAYMEGDDFGDILYFTDGTALCVTSDGGHHIEYLDQTEVRALHRERQGARERARLRRLQRAEWLSISCEERGERRAAKEAAMGWMERAVYDMFGDRHGYLLTPTRYRRLCPVCGDYECENTKTVPAEIDFGTMTINISKPT